MMTIKALLSLILLLSSVFCSSQAVNNRILLTVNGRTTEAGEFIRMYNKSIEPGKSLDVDGYLDQFILFKLKVADAIHEGMDTTRAFRTELNGYRDQLAQNYLTDNSLKEKLLKAAYQKSLTEINASHILIGLAPNATPADTLRAWDKAIDIRERILKGESFEQVARSSSDDKSVLTNGGNLGYFSVFQMIPPFEDAAYALKPGAISKPVRTAYGYHIIKVNDKRPSRGRIKVAHIMKSAPPGIPDETAKAAKDGIDMVYDLLLKGGNFSELAAKYSDHKETASMGGEMEWFGTGEIISEFSEAAFALKDTGEYTKPVRTLYGWHIIKLNARQPVRSYEESKSYLESRINQSYLNALSKRSFVETLKKEYKFRLNAEAYNWFIRNTDTLLIQGLRKYNRELMPRGELYAWADRKVTTADFAAYTEKRGYIIETKDSVVFLKNTLETMVEDNLINYENARLENKYPEFRYLMNEFHDGILLFEISNRKVWNRVSNDSAGLLNYYEKNKHKYLTEPGIAGKIYTLRIKDGDNALFSAYSRYSAKKNPDQLLLKKFNRKKDSTLTITEGKWIKGQDKNLDGLKWTPGIQQTEIDGFPSILNITGTTEPVPLPFEEVQGEMMSDWQEYLENEWETQLKMSYSVKTDNAVLTEVKKQLGQK